MRRSQRLCASETKSRYFEHDPVESDDSVAPPKAPKHKVNSTKRGRPSSADELQLYGESEDATEDETHDDSEPAPTKKRGRPLRTNPDKRRRAPGDDDGNARTPRKRARGRPAKASSVEKAVATSGNEGGDDSDDEDRRVEFIPLPKLRDTGGVEYDPSTVHPNTMAFLVDLKANNKRSWLKRRRIHHSTEP